MDRPRPLVSRRTVLRAGTLAGLSGLAPRRAAAVGTPPQPVAAAAADDLVDAFGVVIHLHFGDTVYADHDAVVAWLSALGVRHARTRLTARTEVLDGFEDLARRGIKVQGVCGALGDPEPMDSLMRAVRTRFPDPTQVFSAFEGINEPNNDDVPWVEETRAKTRALHEARTAHDLSAIPIVAPSLARVGSGGVEGANTREQAVRLGDLSAWVDHGNMHVYPRGLQPSTDIEHFTSVAREVAPGRSVFCTEGGYFTATEYEGGAFPVPPLVAAAYAPQMLLEHWVSGTRRFFRYELFDDPGFGPDEREAHFGMVARTGAGILSLPFPKPDFVSTRRLLEIFGDPGPRFEPAPLEMALTGPADLRSALFARRDGSHLLCLWSDRSVYDPVERRMKRGLIAPAATADLRLGRAADVVVESLVTPYRTTRHDRVRQLSLDLPSGVTVLRLTP